MVKTDAIEGIVNETLRFHYDLTADVLYLRLLVAEESQTYSEVTDDGDLLLRAVQTDQPVGLTVVSWWKRYGDGALPDSIAQIQQHVEPLANQVAA
jgi:hypothetical protein